MAFRDFFVAVLLAVMSFEVRRTQGRTYIDQASNGGPHVTQQNVYTNDAKPVVFTLNNYDGNGPKTQVNYRSAVQNNFGSYNHYPNVGGNFVGKRQEGRKYYGIQSNNGEDETHWDGHDGHTNNAFDGFLQYNSNSHVLNNFGGFSGPNIPDKSTRDQAEKPRGSGGDFTFVQHNVNSPVTHVYPQKKFITPESDPNFRGTIDNGDNAYAGTNTGRSPTGKGSGGTHYIGHGDNILRKGSANGVANGNREEGPVHSVERWGNKNDGGSGIPDGQSIPVGGHYGGSAANDPRRSDGGFAANDPRRSNGGFAANDPRRFDGGSNASGPYPGTTYRPPTQYNGNGTPTPVDSRRLSRVDALRMEWM